MVVLKKLKGSTLMETLVATILIIVVLTVASLLLNTMFMSSVKNYTSDIDTYLKELHYQYIHKDLELPHFETFQDWDIQLDRKDSKLIQFSAIQTNTKKSVVIEYYDYK